MPRAAVAVLTAMSVLACRPYASADRLTDQKGLVPAAQFARYGTEQAELVAIGRSLAAWRMTEDSTGLISQAEHAACFARRLPHVVTVDPDPLGHRLTIRFKSGWRAAALPIDDGVLPDSTPGIRLGPMPASCS